MVQPPSRVIGVERNDHLAHRGDQDGVAHGAVEASAVDADNLEMMAMQVHGMRHHRVVHQFEFNALAANDL